MTPAKLPTVPQMRNRALSGHELALAAIAEGRPIAAAAPSSVRGMRIVLSTLRRWECVDDDGITDRGRELLAALRETHGR